MKLEIKNPAIAICVATLALLAFPFNTHAAFTGLFAQDKSQVGYTLGRTHFVVNVWARFSDPGDRLLGVSQAQISMTGGASLHHHPLGGDTAPDSELFGQPGAETLPFDSFVTIGLKSVPIGGTDGTTLETASGFTGPGGGSGFQGGWFNSDPANGQGDPIPVPSIPGPGVFVLIAQLTIQNPTPIAGFGGNLILHWKAAGSTTVTSSMTAFFSPFVPPLPSAGALPLLALGAMTGRRRRQ